MRILIPLLCFAAGLFLLVNGCSWTSGPWPSYAPAPLTKNVKKLEPVQDLARLRKLFKDHDGNLLSRDDKVVKWKDTRMFRMFEFKHHTVVIFPYNWLDGSRKDERFDLHVFVGHVKDYSNLFDEICTYDEERRRRRWLDVTSPVVQDVGFESFRLGELQSNAIEKQVKYLRGWGMRVRVKRSKEREGDEWLVSVDDAGKENGSVASWDDHGMSGWRGDTGTRTTTLHFAFGSEDGRLSSMHFFTEKCPLLAGYSILNPVLPVLEEGEFEIPAEE